MDYDVDDLNAAWCRSDVEAAIEILDSLNPNEFDKNLAFSLIQNTIGYYEGDALSDIELEILRLYLNKRAEYVPYNVNDAIIKRIGEEEDYISTREVETLCEQINISSCSIDQKIKLVKALKTYIGEHECSKYTGITKFLEKILDSPLSEECFGHRTSNELACKASVLDPKSNRALAGDFLFGGKGRDPVGSTVAAIQKMM